MTAFEDALATAKAEYDAVAREVVLADADRDAAIANLEKLREEFAAYKTTHPDPIPVPPALRTVFGGCPPAGGTTAAAVQSVIDKWGPGSAVRLFFASGSGVAQRPATAGVVHVSWKPTLAQITDAWVKSTTANLKPGDVVEVWHEADLKVRKGNLTKADVVGRKNAFFDAVKQVRPDLLVANTLTGMALSDYDNDEWKTWGVVKADLLGLDADGIHDNAAPLDIKYEDEIERVGKFLAANPSYKGWAVPEFGTSRPGWDSKGLERAAWAKKYGGLFAAAGALYVTLYDYDSTPGNEFDAGTPEFNVWRGFTAP